MLQPGDFTRTNTDILGKSKFPNLLTLQDFRIEFLDNESGRCKLNVSASHAQQCSCCKTLFQVLHMREAWHTLQDPFSIRAAFWNTCRFICSSRLWNHGELHPYLPQPETVSWNEVHGGGGNMFATEVGGVGLHTSSDTPEASETCEAPEVNCWNLED